MNILITKNQTNRLINKIINESNGMTIDKILAKLSRFDYIILYEDSEWLLFLPLTEKGRAYLSYNTEWPINAGVYSLKSDYRITSAKNHEFYDIKNGPLYVLISKSDNTNKYMFYFKHEPDFLYANGETINFKKEDRSFNKICNIIGKTHIKIVNDGIINIDTIILSEFPIESLGDVKRIHKSLHLIDTEIKSLGELEVVDGDLLILSDYINSLGKLKKVGGVILLSSPNFDEYSIEDLEYIYPRFKGKIQHFK